DHGLECERQAGQADGGCRDWSGESKLDFSSEQDLRDRVFGHEEVTRGEVIEKRLKESQMRVTIATKGLYLITQRTTSTWSLMSRVSWRASGNMDHYRALNCRADDVGCSGSGRRDPRQSAAWARSRPNGRSGQGGAWCPGTATTSAVLAVGSELV